MSVYEERYEVSVGRMSHYTSDPAEALRIYNSRMVPDDYNVMPKGWIAEGYADYRDMRDGRTEVTRRQIGPVLPSTLEYIVYRAKVQKMLEEIR